MYVLRLFPMERLVDRCIPLFPKLMSVGINPVTYIDPYNFHPSYNPRQRPSNFLGKARSTSRILSHINFKCLTLVHIQTKINCMKVSSARMQPTLVFRVGLVFICHFLSFFKI